MIDDKVYTAIGLMSGTSLDGIDAALIQTDGHDMVKAIDFISKPYDEALRDALRQCMAEKQPCTHTRETEIAMTKKHLEVIQELRARNEDKPDIIGFHGQTLHHDPEKGYTWQIGDGHLMATELGIPVVKDFRQNDMQHGGQGAPLLPVYHRVLVYDLEKPVAVLNLGGVGNITWIGETSDEFLAFDTGPGNAQMDDFIRKHTDQRFDKDGALAQKGKPDYEMVKSWMEHPYFAKTPPKSLDRDEWDVSAVKDLSLEDGLATLGTFTVHAVAQSVSQLPKEPKQILVCGGGRYNKFLMETLGRKLCLPVKPIEDIGANGDAIEAQGFAYMAVRSKLGLPLTFPGTTGASESVTGGLLVDA